MSGILHSFRRHNTKQPANGIQAIEELAELDGLSDGQLRKLLSLERKLRDELEVQRTRWHEELSRPVRETRGRSETDTAAEKERQRRYYALVGLINEGDGIREALELMIQRSASGLAGGASALKNSRDVQDRSLSWVIGVRSFWGEPEDG